MVVASAKRALRLSQTTIGIFVVQRYDAPHLVIILVPTQAEYLALAPAGEIAKA